MLVRVVEGVLQQPHVRRLHGAEHDAQLRLPKTDAAPHARAGSPTSHRAGSTGTTTRRQTTPHVDHGDEPHARVRLEAVRGEPLVDRVQQPEVAGHYGGAAAGKRLRAGARARLEDVEGAAEEERELDGRAQGGAFVGRGVVGWEDGYVEGVVISSYDAQAGYRGYRGRHCRMYVLLPAV